MSLTKYMEVFTMDEMNDSMAFGAPLTACCFDRGSGRIGMVFGGSNSEVWTVKAVVSELDLVDRVSLSLGLVEI